MEKVCGIYKISCDKVSVVYIGQSIDIYTRWKQHKTQLKHNRHTNSYLQNIYNKYGVDTFNYEVLEVCSLKNIDERERFWISFYGGVESKRNCNWESGGHHHKKFSIELKQRQSLSHKGQHSSPNTEFQKGIIPWNKGKKTSEESKEKLRASHLGLKVKEETKKKISQTLKGKIVGKDRYNAQPLSCYDKNGTLVKDYDTFKDASLDIGVRPSSIAKAIRKNKMCKGLYWKRRKK